MEEKDTEQPSQVSKETTPKVEVPNGADKSSTPGATSVQQNLRATAPEEDDTNEVELSPPPDSSSVSSVNPDMLGDEIIVGTNVNGQKHARSDHGSDHGDEEMVDADTDTDDKPISHYPKRKRSTIYKDLGEDKIELKDSDDNAPPSQPQKRHGSAHVKGVILGYWRDSPVPDETDRHAVIGFMDVRDRLRTRIQCHTRGGDAINTRLFPIPPGPGGSWVTFERVIFEDHLIGLDHHQVKEYVKLRSEVEKGEESPDVKLKAQIAAVKEAKHRLLVNPPTEANQQPSIAWGKELPENLQSTRPEKRRRINGSVVGPIGTSGSATPQQVLPPLPQHQQPRGVSPMLGTRPTRILVGCWLKSDTKEDSERHAVFGILGANDMFRVKLMRETMDGRYHEGNFPTGAGALWINYEEVKFLPHLQNLTRPEMKEYVRIRQSQIDLGESDETRVANETQAVYEAQRRASQIAKHAATASSTTRQPVNSIDREDRQDTPKSEVRSQEIRGQEARGQETRNQETRGQDTRAREIRGQEPQQERRMTAQHDGRPSRHSLPESGLQLGSRSNSIDVERQRGIVSRTIDRMELNQVRDQRNATQRAAVLNTVPAHDVRRDFNDNIQRMDKIWQAQELSRQGPSNDNIKVYAGIKYERKKNGPFEGKLVSQGTIISIDGEDYVEYRVLTKPTFF